MNSVPTLRLHGLGALGRAVNHKRVTTLIHSYILPPDIVLRVVVYCVESSGEEHRVVNMGRIVIKFSTNKNNQSIAYSCW